MYLISPISYFAALDFKSSIIIFCGLVIILLLIALIALIGKNNQSAASQQGTSPITIRNNTPLIEEDISDEVVAVIAAAIAMMSDSTDGTQYSIRGIKRINSGRSAWATAGLLDNTRSF